MAPVDAIDVEVAHAAPTRQRVAKIRVVPPCTVERAIRESGILAEFPGLSVERGSVGIFGEVVELEHELRAGDRVEIYRPLTRDPKDARRERAARSRCGS